MRIGQKIKLLMADITTLRSMPLSMPPTALCWEEVGLTAPFTVQQDRSSWENAGRSAAAQREKRASPGAIGFPLALSFTPLGRSGGVDQRARISFSPDAIRAALPWQRRTK